MEGDEGNNESNNSRNEKRTNKSVERNVYEKCSEYIDKLYNEGLKIELLYKDMYEMDIIELENTIIERRKGLAYKIWRLSTFVKSPFIKEFPETPEKAMPELFPPKPTIKMPNFLMDKYLKREGVMKWTNME